MTKPSEGKFADARQNLAQGFRELGFRFRRREDDHRALGLLHTAHNRNRRAPALFEVCSKVRCSSGEYGI